MSSTLVDRQPQQCSTLTWLLVGDIREMLQDHLDAEAIHWLKPILDALIGAMAKQSELTIDECWHDDLLGDFPHMISQVARLEAEQTALCKHLRELRHWIERDLPFDRLASEIERGLTDWVELMIKHSRREALLLQDALYSEIGGEG